MSLDLLFPEGRKVTISGEVVTVNKFYTLQFPQAARLLQPVLNLLTASNLLKLRTVPVKGKHPASTEVVFADDWMMHVLDAVGDGGDLIIDLCAFAIGKERAFFEKVELDEFLELVQAIFEVNSDFFKKRILPKLGVLMQNAAQTGSTPTIPSKPLDGAEMTSTISP